MKDHIDELVFIHTDGFISKTKLNIQVGTNLGDLKYCGYCKNTQIINTNEKTPSKQFIL